MYRHRAPMPPLHPAPHRSRRLSSTFFTNLHEPIPSGAHLRHSSSSLCPSLFSSSPCLGPHVSSSCSDATSSSCAAPIATPILDLFFTNLHEPIPSGAHLRHSSSSLCPSLLAPSPCPGASMYLACISATSWMMLYLHVSRLYLRDLLDDAVSPYISPVSPRPPG